VQSVMFASQVLIGRNGGKRMPQLLPKARQAAPCGRSGARQREGRHREVHQRIPPGVLRGESSDVRGEEVRRAAP